MPLPRLRSSLPPSVALAGGRAEEGASRGGGRAPHLGRTPPDLGLFILRIFLPCDVFAPLYPPPLAPSSCLPKRPLERLFDAAGVRRRFCTGRGFPKDGPVAPLRLQISTLINLFRGIRRRRIPRDWGQSQVQDLPSGRSYASPPSASAERGSARGDAPLALMLRGGLRC